MLGFQGAARWKCRRQPSVFAVPCVMLSLPAGVETSLKDWIVGDGTALHRLLADDVEWAITGNSVVSGTYHGWAELNAKVLSPFRASFSRSQDRFRPRKMSTRMVIRLSPIWMLRERPTMESHMPTRMCGYSPCATATQSA